MLATALDSAGQPIPSESVQWSSSDSSIIAVTPKGSLRAKKTGNAFVYAETHGKKGRGNVNVTDTLPSKVIVSPSTASAAVGASVQLSASVETRSGRKLPDHVVQWSSSDAHAVTVSPTGVATAHGTGSARIYAAASSQAVDTAVVQVAAASIAGVTVAPATSTLASGSTVQLTAKATDKSGSQLSGRAVGWSSSDETIASVSTTGTVTTAKTGTATITATIEGVRATSTLHVKTGGAKTITVTPGSVGVVAGATQQLSVSLRDASGNPVSTQSVTWTSSNSATATVSSTGLVTAVHTGSATISAKANNLTGNASVVVSAGAVKSISVTPATLSLATGGTQQLTAALTDALGNPLTGQAVAWSSSNTTIATVSSSGLVTAKLAGSATITAAAGGATDNTVVTVNAGAVSSVAVSPGSVSLVAGGTQQLAAKLTDASGSTVTGQTVTWTSSNSSIVSVSSSGMATVAKVGNATVTATAGGKSGQAAFAVAAGPVNAVTITPASATVQATKTVQLSAAYTDVGGNAVAAKSVAWSSSSTGIAGVSSTGLVTGVAAGSSNVSVVADGKSKSASVTVTAATTTTPTLSSLVLSPNTVTLGTGKTQQFAVTGTWSDGSTKTPLVNYSGAGGTITSGGLYTAGTTTGTFRVIAAQQGGSRVDTSVVTISGSTTTPPPIQTACSQIPHSRLVSVSTTAQLSSALSGAAPGDLIDMADGTYGGTTEFRVTTAGTASQRITLCGTANAVINAGSISNRDGIHATGANYWTFSGFTITNALFGFYAERSTHLLLQGLTIHGIGQEGIEIAAFSKNAVITGNRIYDTGNTIAEYGEGIYVGSANAKWATLTGGLPDATDSVLIEGNNIGPNVRAEHIDAKEGTHGGVIRNNTFNGSGMIESQGTGESGWPNSWVILQGIGYQVYNNTGSNALVAGFRVVTHGTVETGLDNTFSSNTFDVNGALYGFLIQAPSANANVVSCTNSVSGDTKAMSNVGCK